MWIGPSVRSRFYSHQSVRDSEQHASLDPNDSHGRVNVNTRGGTTHGSGSNTAHTGRAPGRGRGGYGRGRGGYVSHIGQINRGGSHYFRETTRGRRGGRGRSRGRSRGRGRARRTGGGGGGGYPNQNNYYQHANNYNNQHQHKNPRGMGINANMNDQYYDLQNQGRGRGGLPNETGRDIRKSGYGYVGPTHPLPRDIYKRFDMNISPANLPNAAAGGISGSGGGSAHGCGTGLDDSSATANAANRSHSNLGSLHDEKDKENKTALSSNALSSNALSSADSYSNDDTFRPYRYGRTTQSKYRKKPTPKRADIEANEIRIRGTGGNIKQYVLYATNLLSNSKYNSNNNNRYNTAKDGKGKGKNKPQARYDLIQISATGRAIGKAVNCVEVIKRKIYGLHQLTRLKTVILSEIWEPLESGLREVKIDTAISGIDILLTFKSENLDTSDVGYQAPISWIDLGDAREYLNRIKLQKNKMREMQLKYDNQKAKIKEMRSKYNLLSVKSKKEQVGSDARQVGFDEQTVLYNQQTMDYGAQTSKYNALETKYDEMKFKYDAREVQQKQKKKEYEAWNANDVTEWITGLNEKYYKYKDNLLQGLSEQGIDGSCLTEISKEDLYRLGVTNFKDKRDIYNSILQFTQQQQ